MNRSPLFKYIFLLLCIVAILHVVATYLYWYLTVPWFDIPMHLLGGATVALVYFAIFGQPKALKRVILFVFIAGVLWEVFELLIGVTFLSDGWNYVLDTAKDLADDIVGGWVASRYAIKFLNKING